jgi:anaphase-promoting complex subunit 3
MEKLGHPKAALTQYSHALNLAPNSALARFKKARVLMGLKHYADALVELEVLKNLAPEEANVFFLLGKCFKGLGRRADSVRTFTTALNLDAKVRYIYYHVADSC